jgi:hypothetical protein
MANVQDANTPDPPLLVDVNPNVVPENAVIKPSMKLAGEAVLNTRTRCPAVNAVAVAAKLVSNANTASLEIVRFEFDVNPA